MKLLKSTLAILLAVLMVFSLAACGGADDGNTDDGGKGGSAKFEPTTIELDMCKINVLGAEKITDSEDKPAFRLWFDITNTTDETNYPSYFYEFSATQDGYELTETYASYESTVPAAEVGFYNIRPTVTVRACVEYNYKEDGGTIIAGFNNYYSEEAPKTVEIDPQNFSGAPADEFTPEKVEDPLFLADYPAKGTYEAFGVKYDVSIDKFEITEDFDGESIIRVYYTFKNNSEENQKFNLVFTPEAYQDGIQLHPGYPKEKVAEEDAYLEEVKPGDSITVAQCYELAGDSPVEVDLTDLFGTGVGVVYAVK